MIYQVAITGILLILFCFNIYTNYFHYKNFLLLNILNIVLSYFIFKESNIFFSLVMLYCLSSSCYHSTYLKPIHYAHPSGGLNTSLLINIAKSYLMLIFCSLFFITIPVKEFLISIKILHVINILMTLIPAKYTFFKTETNETSKSPICGFDANISTNATLLSLMSCSYLIDFGQNIYFNSCVLMLTFLAILKTTASVGLISFTASIMIFILTSSSASASIMVVAAAIICLMVAAIFRSKFKPGSRIFSISGRDNIFRFVNKWIKPRSNKYFGSGIGSFSYVFPATHQQISSQSLNQFKIANYIWLHSDVYQFYIEGGLIGFFLGSVAFLYAIYLCVLSNNYAGLCFLASYLLNSLGNFPNHLVPDIITIVVMFKFIATLG